ncbi:hypothetical protein [Pseudosulfitobacter sp. SM2401]|uniref:hypothetical protein n=1 Tax=Pseudosulfitobacter sp. SM2401 TaxID=3350098 RepID=UPI0036F3A570
MTAKHVLAVLMTLGVLGFIVLIVLSEQRLGVGEGLLDGRIGGYTVQDVYLYLQQISPQDRAFYLGPFRTLDTVVPLVMALGLAGMIWLHSAPILRVAALLPLFYLGFDWYENALVAQILTDGLKGLDMHLVTKASQMTVAKWAFLLASIGVTILAWRKARVAT